MANLPEKNITAVDKITSIPGNTNLYINANGEFKQATVDDVLKASPVIANSISNQYKNASGSPILLTDSAKGVAIDFEVKGRSTQTQYSGKNLWSGGDVSGTKYKEVMIDIDKGTYTISALVTSSGTDASDSSIHFFNESGADFLQIYLTRGVRASKTFNLSEKAVKCWFLAESTYANSDNDTFGYTDIQLESGEKATDYEPYVGGTASPNPTYPQAIKSVGDMGYFDGELLNGVYSTSNGIYGSNANYLCNKNPIPCNASDDVTFTYHTDTQYNLMILFYDEDMNYLSYKNTTTSDTLTATAPTNASYCNFNIGYGSALSVANASPITVTINDKYALIVDSVGKNLLNNTATSKIINGVTFTVNEDKSVTVNTNGTTSAVTSILLGTYTFKANESYILSGQKTNTLLTFGKNSDGSGLAVFDSTVYTPTEDITLYARLLVDKGTTVNDTIYPMLRLASVTDATYEPYIKSRKYIPISAPLRGIGEVTDVASLSECEVTRKVTRKFAEVVFDGSDDESWVANSDISVFYIVIDNIKILQSCICDHYSNMYTNSIGYLCINARDTGCATLAEFKAQLQSNPITVIYELTEPTTESIEPIDVDTFEGVTHISCSDGAEMEIEYPTSKVAGIASIGWSKGRRAEYDLVQLKAQMLALQTMIVSTV